MYDPIKECDDGDPLVFYPIDGHPPSFYECSNEKAMEIFKAEMAARPMQ